MATKDVLNIFLLRIILIISLLSRGFISSSDVPEIAVLQLEFKFSNPDHMSAYGKCDDSFGDIWCDVFFKICITTDNAQRDCDLLDLETTKHKDQSYIDYTGKNAIKMPIKKPIPKYLKIMIAAIDYDLYTSDDHIASFMSRNFEVPISNVSKDANLQIIEPNNNNKGVKLKGSLTLICNPDYYGDYCAVHCLPNLSPRTLACHPNGSFICNKGFRGENCEKADPCFYSPCISDATCLNTDDGKGYQCHCGGTQGQHCYANFNPCVPSPCQNDGRCVRSGKNDETYMCKCSYRWAGKQCTETLSPCEVARHKLATADLADLFDGRPSLNSSSSTVSTVCYNGGICVDNFDDFKFSCNCTTGWSGERCDEPNRKMAIISGSICFGIVFIILLAIIPCIIRIVEKRKAYLKEISGCGFIYKQTYPTYFDNVVSTPYQTVCYLKQLDTSGGQLAPFDSSYEYDYCNPLYTVPPSNELVTFTTGEKEKLSSLGPPLPERPKTLCPALHENATLRFHQFANDRSHVESTNSEHPLLSPSIHSTNYEDQDALPYRAKP